MVISAKIGFYQSLELLIKLFKGLLTGKSKTFQDYKTCMFAGA